jgi:23S rRNA pseudouridine1911/1915/1917 synthase
VRGGAGRATFVVVPEDEGRRLDQVLAARLPALSRRRARVLIDLGGVFVDGRRVKVAGRPVRAGERVVAHTGGALERATKRVGRGAREADEARLPPFSILFEDEDLLVADKPAGLLTAPTPESDRGNLWSLLARRPGGGRVFVVHRLDLDTSGVIAFAKTDAANRTLAERFRRHDLERSYVGFARGDFPAHATRLETPVAGRPALTFADVEERFAGRATRVRFRLETGRTHQIRIQCRAVGHPILGDPLYGEPMPDDPPRLALHAERLAFLHPRTGAPLRFESPLPEDLVRWTEALRRVASEPDSKNIQKSPPSGPGH